MDLKSSFDINKMGFIIVSTDEMGYGIDYGDYILGFTYGSSEIYFDFPGRRSVRHTKIPVDITQN